MWIFDIIKCIIIFKAWMDFNTHFAVKGVRSFYECATYALSHLPLDDDVLLNAQFVDVQERLQADFTQITYFVAHFSELLPYSDTKFQERLSYSTSLCWTMQFQLTFGTMQWYWRKMRMMSRWRIIEDHVVGISWQYDRSSHRSA